MKTIYAALCVVVSLLASPGVAQDAPPSAAQVASSVDRFYEEQVSSLRQRFWLTQSSRMTSHLQRSWGELLVKKPGKLRLSFDVDARSASSGEVMTLDGSRFSHYAPGEDGEPGTIQDIVARDASLAAPLGFLLGRGHITDAYTVRSVTPPTDFRPRTGTAYALVLTPRRAGAQQSVILCVAYVRPGVATVRRVTLVAHDGSRTRYDLTGEAQVNGSSGVSDGDFRFTPPGGTQRLTAR